MYRKVNACVLNLTFWQVNFANSCGIPFLTVSGGHGWQSTLGNASGIQLNMRKMQEVRLSDNGDTVHVGGGVKQKHLVDSLYKLDKQAVTGLCECTSVIGPLLGGGHSALQGMYGFVSDGLVSAQVVLANGTAITSSALQHSDLFWALRGAGHNFGIVTSFEIKAYDLPKKNWTITSVVYTQNKLESFVDTLNEVDAGGDHVPELVLSGAITHIPSLDDRYPVIAYQITFLGTPEEAEQYVQPFREVGPISMTVATDVEYKDYAVATNSGLDQPPCRDDLNIMSYAISLPSYNKTAMRVGFECFSELTADSRYKSSAWLLESYGSRGVWAQDYGASAVPREERDLPVLTGAITWWAGDSPDARDKAEKYGRSIRSALAAGASEDVNVAHVYLNYAVGSESLQQVYGGDRLQRLRALKAKYDRFDRFRFYMPIV